MKFTFLILFYFVSIHGVELNFNTKIEPDLMVASVNEIRLKGCYCGKRFMPPISKIEWNDELYKSAYFHAQDMNENHFFAHFSKEGLDIGARLEKIGYDWQVAGENLGEGQTSFDEVLRDWMNSYTHCKMIMNPKVNEMAVAKVGKYWVQHFGKQMPNKK